MEMNNVYITEYLLDCIFDKMTDRDYILFSHINRVTYKRYKPIIKNKIFGYINTNYELFSQLIRSYSYSDDELGLLTQDSIYKMKPMNIFNNYYYDLRYVFELIYKDKRIFDTFSFPKKCRNLKLIILNIRKSISFNRSETMNNINNNPILIPLRRINTMGIS
tara:strand:- start:5366 stop:5854 length:489 start_codon:yes stop_codon:yes gene_type:complete